jgi:hypothetical protein
MAEGKVDGMFLMAEMVKQGHGHTGGKREIPTRALG